MLRRVDLGIADKTALVTGASRGLGASICRGLATEGVKIIACARTADQLLQLVSELPGDVAHSAIPVDLSGPGAAQELISAVDALGLEPDIIVNNVGGTLDLNDPLASAAEFERVWRLNLGIAVDINRHYIPGMQQRKWGRICHVSSISALENQGPPAYCATKAAVNAYVRSVGRYVSADNVILTGVMPGAVCTEGGYWDEASRERPEHVRRYLDERMAIKRFGTEEEISALVTFLTSEHASFCVGSMLLADGGQGRVFYPQGQ